MTKIIKVAILLNLLFLFTELLPLKSVYAQDATDSASTEEIQKSLQDRIKKALNENLPDAENTLNQSKKRAVVGIIDSLNQNEITVLVNQGKGDAQHRHQVIYTPDTTFTRSGRTIETTALSIGEYIIAIGTPINESSLQTSHAIVATLVPANINTQIAYATVSNLDLKNDTLTLTPLSPTEFDVTAKTKILTPTQQKLELKDLSESQKVAAVLTINTTKKTTTLSSLIVFPGATNSPTPVTQTTSSCGDNICQNVSCFGVDCPTPESPETCPVDCTK